MNEKELELLDTVGLKPCRVLTRRPVTVALGRGFYVPGLVGAFLGFTVSYQHGFVTAAFAAALAGLVLTGSLLAHECGHLLLGRHVRGVTPRILMLRSTGGASIVEGRFEDARGAATFAAGGPLATLAAAVLCTVAGLALPSGPFRSALLLPAVLNALLLLINLLPVAPMDGFMLSRSALWARTGSRAEAEKRALAWSRAVLAWGLALSLFVFMRSREAGALSVLVLSAFVVQHHLVVRRVASRRQRREPNRRPSVHA